MQKYIARMTDSQ